MHTLAYREALAPNSLGSEQPRTWDLPRTSYDVRLQSLGSPRAPSLEAPQTLDGGASGSGPSLGGAPHRPERGANQAAPRRRRYIKKTRAGSTVVRFARGFPRKVAMHSLELLGINREASNHDFRWGSIGKLRIWLEFTKILL